MSMGKSLIMTQVQIRLGAIIRNEHFPMLKGAHGSRIDIQIRIELLESDTKPAAFEETAQRRRGDPLP
jgi:hypothetical protein